MILKGAKHMKDWSISRKIILGAIILMVISLFLPWTKFLFLSASGFKHNMYILLIIFIYPLVVVFQDEKLHKGLGYGCGVSAIGICLWFIGRSSGEFLGSFISVAGIGVYLFILSCLLFMFGIFKQEEETEKES